MSEFEVSMMMSLMGAIGGIIVFYVVTLTSFEQKRKKIIKETEDIKEEIIKETEDIKEEIIKESEYKKEWVIETGREQIEKEKNKALLEADNEVVKRMENVKQREDEVNKREAKIQTYTNEINKLQKEIDKLKESNSTFKKIVRDKKLAYLKMLAKNVDINRLKREIKKANKQLIALSDIDQEVDTNLTLGAGIKV